MRILVLLKSGVYYICSDVINEKDPFWCEYEIALGGKLKVPKNDIHSIEKYDMDNTFEANRFRYQYDKLQKDNTFHEG